MARWVVFVDRIVGHVEAPRRDDALQLAIQQYGQTHSISRVQSEASYQLGLEEQQALARRRPPHDVAD